MNYKNKTEHRVAVLNVVNDAEAFLVVSDQGFALGGEHRIIVGALATAISSNEDFRLVVAEAITKVMKYKQELKTEK